MNIFSIKEFMPRSECMNNETWTLVIYTVGSLGVFLAYFFIPLILLRFRKILKPMFPNLVGRGLVLAALFILFCGGGHLIDIFLIKYPFYRFSAIWTCLTGIVSWLFIFQVFRYLKLFVNIIKINKNIPTKEKDV